MDKTAKNSDCMERFGRLLRFCGAGIEGRTTRQSHQADNQNDPTECISQSSLPIFPLNATRGRRYFQRSRFPGPPGTNPA